MDTTAIKELQRLAQTLHAHLEQDRAERQKLVLPLVRLEERLRQVQSGLAKLRGEGLPRCAVQDQRLIETERRLGELTGAFGSRPSCVAHQQRLGFLEERLATLCTRLWWLASAATTAVAAPWLRSLWETLK